MILSFAILKIMRKFLVIFFAIVFFLFISRTFPAQAQRYASCDLCGLCQVDKTIQSQPSNWESCRACLYPELTSYPASDLQTVLVEPTNNLPPTPYTGHTYTMIGCIQTDLQLVGQKGSAASVVQVLLNVLFGVIGAIAFLYLIYGSFIILTSQADPERLNYGKRLVMGALVGVTFTLLSAFIVNFLATGILKIPGF